MLRRALLLMLALSLSFPSSAWKRTSRSSASSVEGDVCDEHGRVADVQVRFKGTKDHTTTDASGHFNLAGAGSRITAAKPGYFIAGAPADSTPLTLHLRPLPKDDNPDYQWVESPPSGEKPQNCGNCHGEIAKEWAGSAHGRAGRNRHFLNLYDGTDWNGRPDVGWNLLKEHPVGASVCAACHAPTVPLDHAGYDDFRKLEGVHASGVHCDYCHKIASVSTERLGLEHGRFAHQLLRPALRDKPGGSSDKPGGSSDKPGGSSGQIFFGPLDDVDRDEDSYAPFYSESRYCASCHEGTVFGVKVYTTYSEWLVSPPRKQGKQCQTCHMTPTGKMDNIAPGKGGIPRDPASLASHVMPGGDLKMLQSCLRLKVKLRRSQDGLNVEAETLATDVGHRVPTGFIDRNIVLLVEALSAVGERVPPASGPKLHEGAGLGGAEGRGFAGLPGRFFAKQIEDLSGRRPVPFWRPSREFADTRLVPDQPDRAAWSFAADAAAKVHIRLIYRRFFQTTAESKKWPDNEISVVDETIPIPPTLQQVEKLFPAAK